MIFTKKYKEFANEGFFDTIKKGYSDETKPERRSRRRNRTSEDKGVVVGDRGSFKSGYFKGYKLATDITFYEGEKLADRVTRYVKRKNQILRGVNTGNPDEDTLPLMDTFKNMADNFIEIQTKNKGDNGELIDNDMKYKKLLDIFAVLHTMEKDYTFFKSLGTIARDGSENYEPITITKAANERLEKRLKAALINFDKEFKNIFENIFNVYYSKKIDKKLSDSKRVGLKIQDFIQKFKSYKTGKDKGYFEDRLINYVFRGTPSADAIQLFRNRYLTGLPAQRTRVGLNNLISLYTKINKIDKGVDAFQEHDLEQFRDYYLKMIQKSYSAISKEISDSPSFHHLLTNALLFLGYAFDSDTFPLNTNTDIEVFFKIFFQPEFITTVVSYDRDENEKRLPNKIFSIENLMKESLWRISGIPVWGERNVPFFLSMISKYMANPNVTFGRRSNPIAVHDVLSIYGLLKSGGVVDQIKKYYKKRGFGKSSSAVAEYSPSDNKDASKTVISPNADADEIFDKAIKAYGIPPQKRPEVVKQISRIKNIINDRKKGDIVINWANDYDPGKINVQLIEDKINLFAAFIISFRDRFLKSGATKAIFKSHLDDRLTDHEKAFVFKNLLYLTDELIDFESDGMTLEKTGLELIKPELFFNFETLIRVILQFFSSADIKNKKDFLLHSDLSASNNQDIIMRTFKALFTRKIAETDTDEEGQSADQPQKKFITAVNNLSNFNSKSVLKDIGLGANLDESINVFQKAYVTLSSMSGIKLPEVTLDSGVADYKMKPFTDALKVVANDIYIILLPEMVDKKDSEKLPKPFISIYLKDKAAANYKFTAKTFREYVLNNIAFNLATILYDYMLALKKKNKKDLVNLAISVIVSAPDLYYNYLFEKENRDDLEEVLKSYASTSFKVNANFINKNLNDFKNLFIERQKSK